MNYPMAWRKSSHSAHDGGNCVEVAAINGRIAVRDSKRPTAPILTLNRDTWHRLIGNLKVS